MARRLLDAPSAISLNLASSAQGVATALSMSRLFSDSPPAFFVIHLIPSVALLWTLSLVQRLRTRGCALDGPGIIRTAVGVMFATTSAPSGRKFCREEEAAFSRTEHYPAVSRMDVRDHSFGANFVRREASRGAYTP